MPKGEYPPKTTCHDRFREWGLIDRAFADVGDPRYDVAVATHELPRSDREAFAEGYGSAARLTAKEAAYFVEVSLLF